MALTLPTFYTAVPMYFTSVDLWEYAACSIQISFYMTSIKLQQSTPDPRPCFLLDKSSVPILRAEACLLETHLELPTPGLIFSATSRAIGDGLVQLPSRSVGLEVVASSMPQEDERT